MQHDPKRMSSVIFVNTTAHRECSIETLGNGRPSLSLPKARSTSSFSPSTRTTSRTSCRNVLALTLVLPLSATLNVEADPVLRIGLWCVYGLYAVHWTILMNTAMIADPAGCRSRRSPSGVDPRYAVVHDWDPREQDHTRAFDGSGEAGASHILYSSAEVNLTIGILRPLCLLDP